MSFRSCLLIGLSLVVALHARIALASAYIGDTCPCVKKPNKLRCFSLYKPAVAPEGIPTGTTGLRCFQRPCGDHYECDSYGSIQCQVKNVPYTLECVGARQGHEVCKLERPGGTYLVPYASSDQAYSP